VRLQELDTPSQEVRAPEIVVVEDADEGSIT
jgi:hypothetical protein